MAFTKATSLTDVITVKFNQNGAPIQLLYKFDIGQLSYHLAPVMMDEDAKFVEENDKEENEEEEFKQTTKNENTSDKGSSIADTKKIKPDPHATVEEEEDEIQFDD